MEPLRHGEKPLKNLSASVVRLSLAYAFSHSSTEIPSADSRTIKYNPGCLEYSINDNWRK
jgi:hypothetical protein